MCPSCESGLVAVGTRWSCGHCGGVLVTAAELEQLVHELAPDDLRPLASRLEAGGETGRTCPRCKTGMAVARMADIAIDHCPTHGLWFDGKALAAVLESESHSFARRQTDPRGYDHEGGLLLRLLGLATRLKRPEDL